MIIATRYIGYCCVALAAVGLSVRNASAQTTSRSAQAAAAALEKQANGWLGTPKKWSGVAHAFERAAELRGADDPQSIKDLFMAAAAHTWVGRRAQAQSAFMLAAEWALASGDVETAAHGYTRAAVAAFERKEFADARSLREKAARLARSPLLTVAQREFILSQFVTAAPAVAAGH